MKVLIVQDCATWAFAARASAWKRYSPPGWTVHIATAGDFCCDGYDALLQLDAQGSVEVWAGTQTAKLIGSHCWLHDADPNDWRTRGVNAMRCRGRLAEELQQVDVVAVYNREQQRVVEEMTGKRVVLCPYAPDLAIFNSDGRRQNERLRVGWCFQVSGGLNSFKGLTDILIPLIAEVGSLVDWDVLTPDAGSCLSPEDLAARMRTWDVALCTSSGEGGPQGPFEAAACGCVVLATEVGQIADWQRLINLRMTVPAYRNASEARTVAMRMAYEIRRLAAEPREFVEAVGELLAEDIRQHWNAAIEAPRQLKELFSDR